MTEERQKVIVEKIKNSYTEKTNSDFDEIKALDKKVKTPARVFAYVFGTIGALVLGTGMCLAMEVIGNIMWLGIVIGIVGIAMVSSCYAIYSKILKNRKAKYSSEIIAKSNELLNN